MPRLAISALILLLAVAGCAEKAGKTVTVDICSIRDHVGQLVTTEALLASSGDRTLLRGDACQNLGLELRLTDAAYRAGQIDKLRAAVKAAPVGSAIAVQLTGVLTEEATGSVFAVQSVGPARYPAVD